MFVEDVPRLTFISTYVYFVLESTGLGPHRLRLARIALAGKKKALGRRGPCLPYQYVLIVDNPTD
jgi:hypothetical protein